MQLYEHQKNPNSKFCPRMDAIKHLNTLIEELQKKQHAIVLLLDADQSFDKCFNMSTNIQ